jgi:ribokinase
VTGAPAVCSLGSVNVDRVHRVSGAELSALADRYEWFPERGRTVRVDPGTTPEEFDDADEVRHGGKGANQAVAAARAGADVTMLGTVGTDHGEFGALAALQEEGVDTSRVGVAATPTGRADVFVDPGGDNRIVVQPGANGALDEASLEAHTEAVRSADCLLLQNEVPAAPVVSLLAELAAASDPPVVVLDPAPPEGAERLVGAGGVDYLTPNETEYEVLRPHLDGFDGVLVRKRGGESVVVENGERFTVTPPAVEVVDTTGAGDVLNGFLAARLAAGAPLRAAVETAVVAGSLSVREQGARAGIPTLEDVRAFRAGDEPHGNGRPQ